jgi:hypothetical protein
MKNKFTERQNSLMVKGNIKDLKNFEKDLRSIGFGVSVYNNQRIEYKSNCVCILTYYSSIYGYYPTTELHLDKRHCGEFKLPEQHLEALFLPTPPE